MSQSVMPSGTRVSAGGDVKGGGDFRRRRHDQQLDMAGQAVADLRQQIGMADQDPGAAVGQDVADFLGLQMPVDRHHRGAQRCGRARDLEERKIVAQHHARPACRRRGRAPCNPVAARAMRAWISG